MVNRKINGKIYGTAIDKSEKEAYNPYKPIRKVGI